MVNITTTVLKQPMWRVILHLCIPGTVPGVPGSAKRRVSNRGLDHDNAKGRLSAGHCVRLEMNAVLAMLWQTGGYYLDVDLVVRAHGRNHVELFR